MKLFLCITALTFIFNYIQCSPPTLFTVFYKNIKLKSYALSTFSITNGSLINTHPIANLTSISFYSLDYIAKTDSEGNFYAVGTSFSPQDSMVGLYCISPEGHLVNVSKLVNTNVYAYVPTQNSFGFDVEDNSALYGSTQLGGIVVYAVINIYNFNNPKKSYLVNITDDTDGAVGAYDPENKIYYLFNKDGLTGNFTLFSYSLNSKELLPPIQVLNFEQFFMNTYLVYGGGGQLFVVGDYYVNPKNTTFVIYLLDTESGLLKQIYQTETSDGHYYSYFWVTDDNQYLVFITALSYHDTPTIYTFDMSTFEITQTPLVGFPLDTPIDVDYVPAWVY
ncbi:hypothetical protein DLAC_03664 [Tieghemostelium lacteum]|uniref:Uncharacterized protein n=1 Tax=Tieghemostelium lacteum TaxID=361077 RepID=A0A152A0J4_TIELA|nr:hypothetical protein DLAC_03664 [Tieghemostelium lacteum]|eukprot:KYQ99723.1 hypothetical protein DLAC_03664 [Tieghemostelium lacteum]